MAGATMAGERRIVTVLFADAVSSTSIAERLGEEDMYALMRGCMARMMDAVHTYEGHVASFTGDGVMAVFGAPIAHEESERRAVTAALQMQRALEAYSCEVGARHGIECRFRVGLNTGAVVVGKVSDELAMDFTAIGDTVNLAARMQQLAEPGSVYVTESTYRAVADHIECESLGSLAVKGKGEPVPAWRAVGEKPSRTRLERAADRGLAPFVGRDEELASLERQLTRVQKGRGQLVFISGEAGMGKSRLVLELRHLAGRETRWLQGHCSSFGRTIPYLPVVDLLKRAFSVEEGDNEEQIIGRIEKASSSWAPGARSTAPYLRYLLSVDPGDTRVATMDPRERRAGILDGLRALLYEESARSPLVVVFEDLHWVDESSEQALAALVDAVPATPVLLLLTHRPGYVHGLNRTYSTHLALEALAEEESAALIRGVLGAGPLPPDLERLVADKAEGNPFYTEEILHSLTEEGVLVPAHGGYALTRAIPQVRIPDTVQEVILSRFDRLDLPARGALQLASVIGREFTVRLLGRISDPNRRLDETLGELKGLEFIYERSHFPELAYMFKHALTHDVAYATLLAERRRALHRVVAAAIEELYADRLAEYYETLAHHYLEGWDWENALRYLDRAGRKAAGAYANQDALDYYARALEVCDRLGDPALLTAASLAQRRGFVNFGIGRFAECISDMERTLAAARDLGNRQLEGVALAYLGTGQVWNHDFATAETTLRAAMALAEAHGLVDVRANASVFLGLLLVVLNRLPEAEPHLDFVRRHSAELDDFGRSYWSWLDSRVDLWAGRLDQALVKARERTRTANDVMFNRLWARWNEAHALGSIGEYEAAIAVLKDTMATSERVGDVVILVRCLNTMGWVFSELCDLEAALEWNQRGLDAVRAVHAPTPEVEMNVLINLGENLLSLGRLDEAEARFHEVKRVVRDPQPSDVWMHWRYAQRFFHSFGELRLARGDTEGAITHADECLALAERNGSVKNIAKARRLRAQAFLAEGRLEEADVELTTALDLARDVGSPPQIWKTMAVLGDLRQMEGRAQEARQAYADALSVIDGVASGITDQTLRGTFLQSEEPRRIREAAKAGV